MNGRSSRSPRSQLPFVFVNMAMTADGKTATANRAVSSFGSENDQRQLLLLRSRADAVIAGARTVDSNPINLGPGPATYRRLRLRSGLVEYNLRIIVSGAGSLNPSAEVFRHRFSPIIVLTSERAPANALRRLSKVADEVKVCGRETVDFFQALLWLRKEWKVERLLCEGGGQLNSALLTEGLVCELNLTICPKVVGGDVAPTIADGQGVPVLAQATHLRLKSMKRMGNEMFLVYDVLGKSGSGPHSRPRTAQSEGATIVRPRASPS